VKIVKYQNKRIRIPVLLGPTAVGKTEIALKIAAENNWDILSCDSRQIYRHMDIGTAKPKRNQLNLVKHWMIDEILPSQQYSAYRFSEKSADIIRALAGQNKTVLICGGTGLYFRSLSEGFCNHVESDPELKNQLINRGKEQGSGALYKELSEVDPQSAMKLHQNDMQRIIRALAYFYQTGTSLLQSGSRNNVPEDMEFIVVKVDIERPELYYRINRRVEMMFSDGLYEEFRQLRENGFNSSSPGMQTLGYRELFALEEGKITKQEAVDIIQRNTRRYAKRQITWFKHQVNGIHMNCLYYEKIRNYILRRLSI